MPDRRAKRDESPEALDAEHRRLVGDFQKAIDEQRWDDLGEYIDDYFFALAISEPQLLLDTWPRVSIEWLTQHPRYQLASAWTSATWRSADRIEERIERIFTRWVLTNEEPAARDTLSVHAMEIRQNLVSGRFARANDAADDAARVIRDSDDRDGFDDLLGVVLLHIGLARLVVGDLARAIESFAEGWRWSTSGVPHPIAPYLAGHCALAVALSGDNARADEWLDRAAAPYTDDVHVMSYRLQFAGILATALVAIGRLDRDAADRAIARVDRGIESGDLWWVEAHTRARIALLWGDRAQALRYIEASLDSYPSLTSPSSLAGALLRADVSDIHQSLGDLDAAERALAPLSRSASNPHLAASAVRLFTITGRQNEASALFQRAQGRRMPSVALARWDVLHANLAHLARLPHRAQLAHAAAQQIEITHAFDAAHDALPEVYEDIAEHIAIPGDHSARFVPPPIISLTAREEQVLGLLAAHASVQEIATAMHVSRNTAKTHLRGLYRKLGVSTRADALLASSRLRVRE